MNTWRSSNNQTSPRDRPNHGKNNIDESLRSDYSCPLPLADKDATLKDGEIGNKGITGILQCINEEQPTIHETEENDENKKALVDDVKPEIKNKPKTNDDVIVKLKHVDVKPGSKSKENVTTSYSIPIDFQWKDDQAHKGNSLNNVTAVDQKHLSPIYIEMDDVKDESQNDRENNFYSVPIDFIDGSEKTSGNNKHMSSPTRGKQVAKSTTSLPIITDKMQPNCKPQGIVGSRNDDVYSVPVDDINSNTPSCENLGQRMYTSPINSPGVMNLNPSYKTVQANDSSATEYSDPVTTLSKQTGSHMQYGKDDPFATAVANIQSAKRHKHKPTQPTPYKSKGSSSTAPRQEDPPLYEEVPQTAATLPSNNGLHHSLLPWSLNKTKKTSKSQEPMGLDDYTVPSTDKIRLQKNPSYGDVCDTTETSDYTYILTDRLIRRPNVLEDACTTYTEC